MSTPPRRIGIHLGTAGGASTAVDRARALGANCFQIFSSSPRMWRAPTPPPEQCLRMVEQRKLYDISPLVIHASYLINLCSQNEEVRQKSITGFRGEVDRALALGADYLVLHPGSWKGHSRSHGLTLAAASIAEAITGPTGFAGLDLQQSSLRILIENTAGAEFSLGSSFEQVAELVARLRPVAPVAVCLDTCHSHVAGYDLAEGYEETVQLIAATIGLADVRVWHSNDAKAARGSKLDRHENIGHGTMGLEPFRRLLNDPRFAHAAFIAETPVDEPGDDLRNVNTLRSLVKESGKASPVMAPR